jgi:glycosyltransferase involved in cell wall biosynthesis
MRLSVIVCTRNRAHAIVPCLDSIVRALSRAAPIDAEIVVVDNGSTDHTAAAVAAWPSKASFAVKLQQEPRPGIAGAHNCVSAQQAGSFWSAPTMIAVSTPIISVTPRA